VGDLPHGSAPVAWNTYDKGQFNACNASLSFGDVVLASFSKFSDLGQAGLSSDTVSYRLMWVKVSKSGRKRELTAPMSRPWETKNVPAQPGSLRVKIYKIGLNDILWK
jgi:hypothetical protein